MRASRSAARVFVPFICLLLPSALSAAPTKEPSDQQRATDLFKEASQKEDQATNSAGVGATGQARAQFREAIALYERAFKLFPFPNAKFNSAVCHRAIDELITAHREFQAAAEGYEKNAEKYAKEAEEHAKRKKLDKRDEALRKRDNAVRDRDDALKKAEEVKLLIPKLTIEVSSEVAKLEGLTIYRDGVEFPRTDWNEPLNVDPGDVKIKADASRREPWTHVVRLEPKQQKTVSVPMLYDPNVLSTQKKLAFVSWGVGAAGLIGWGILYAVAKSTWSDSLDACNPTRDPSKACSKDPRTAIPLGDTASTYATLADVSAIIGFAGLAGGAVLFFTAPSPKKLEPSVSLTVNPMGGIRLSGTF